LGYLAHCGQNQQRMHLQPPCSRALSAKSPSTMHERRGLWYTPHSAGTRPAARRRSFASGHFGRVAHNVMMENLTPSWRSSAMRVRIWLLLLLLPSFLHAADPERNHDITVDDYFTLSNLFEIAMSPDGKHVAYTEGRWQQSTDDRKTDLWLTATQDGAVRRLTSDRAGDHSVRWAPDSKTVYFLSARKREGENRPPLDGKQ